MDVEETIFTSHIFMKHSLSKKSIPSRKKSNMARSILAYSRKSTKISVAEVKCAGVEW